MSNLVSKHPELKKTVRKYKQMSKNQRCKNILNGQFARDIVPWLGVNRSWDLALTFGSQHGKLMYYTKDYFTSDYDADGMCFNQLIEMWKESMHDTYDEKFVHGRLSFQYLPDMQHQLSHIKEIFNLQANNALDDLHIAWLFYGWTVEPPYSYKVYDPIIYKYIEQKLKN